VWWKVREPPKEHGEIVISLREYGRVGRERLEARRRRRERRRRMWNRLSFGLLARE
jgi:hypothetical protein